MFFSYAPLPPPLDLGGTKRNLPFFLENVKKNDVSVLTYGTPEQKEIFEKAYGHLCRHIVFVNRKRPMFINALQYLLLLATWRSPMRMVVRTSMQRALNDLLQREQFDVIHCCSPVLGYFKFPDRIPVVSDTHEVTYDLKYRTQQKTRNPLLRAVRYAEYRTARTEEPMLCNKFSAVVATTQRDFNVFRKDIDEKKLFVISNGVQQMFFEPSRSEEEPDTIVFTGLMSYFPNDHGIRHFLQNIFPLILKKRPGAKLLVVGKDPSPGLQRNASERVIVTGYVEDVRPFIARAQVFVIPLFVGGGIRGKALEAMAMKKPIVTTSMGCEGIQLRHNESALFADTATEFADAVVNLLEDGSLRSRLATHAFETVQREYNWTSKGAEMQRVYEFAVKNNHVPEQTHMVREGQAM